MGGRGKGGGGRERFEIFFRKNSMFVLVFKLQRNKNAAVAYVAAVTAAAAAAAAVAAAAGF